MKNIFNASQIVNTGFLQPTTWPTVKRGLIRNLTVITDYYHSRNIAVKGNHLLVRLLSIPRMMLDAPIERFYQNIVANENTIANHMRFTTPVSQGDIFDGVFYGQGSKEIIVVNNESFDLIEATKHWKDQEAVKVVKHNKNDLQMMIPSGVIYSENTDISVISVNIPLLFVMYRCFINEQIKAVEAGMTAKSASQFVYGIVLANMLPSHLDIAIFNRFAALMVGDPIQTPTRKHVITVENMDSGVDKVLTEVGATLKKNNLTLQAMLGHIPAVTMSNMYEALAIPANAPTRQYLWSELVMRLQAIALLVAVSPNKLLNNDRDMLRNMITKSNYSSSIETVVKRLGKQADEYKMIFESVDMLTR